jgi:mannose-6-phosphate isomerase-like protein (cupin superfamily)
MDDYTIVELEDVPDLFEDQYPGKMRLLTPHLGCEQVAFTHRWMPPKSGGKGGYGHSHKTQEEIFYVVRGTLQFKLGDEVLDVHGGTAIRIPPSTVRSVWNDGPDDAELIIVSTYLENARDDAEYTPDFWPA